MQTTEIEKELQTKAENVTDAPVVDFLDKIEAADFKHKYVLANRPVVLRQMMTDWPAMGKWNIDFFRGLNSSTDVHLEEGNVMQEQTKFKRVSFASYLDSLAGPIDASSNAAYLSLFKIFDQFPELRNDVDFSILDQLKVKSSTVGWIGPSGTVTGYHIDWGDNLLAQVQGRKLLHLAAPSESKKMYISSKFDQGTTISRVDLKRVDASAFPLFSGVKHQRVVLNPGEMIFIPRGWWHHVESLDVSISVSNLAYSVRDIFMGVVPHRIKQLLHDCGLWKCDCTCHVVRAAKVGT